ncbi:substrate-binding domain-containing protein [Actinomadura chibensis]|uniref:VWA domain-containing protein n=1 Tax=Actinomadura chibensis TaxID=392828 RepID=A0A5D0NM53_9ACTN|nr:substrate-binding domain-containing protein [Actinomadura chibensis]TYB45590.1 VWA domain-containing protein [Actinomadura chibensis]
MTSHPDQRGSGVLNRPGRSTWIGLLAGVVGLALVAGVGVAVMSKISSCSGDAATRLDVAAAPAVASAVRAAAERVNAAKHEVEGHCVQADVRAVDPAEMALVLSGTGTSPRAGKRPDVWIPDSSLWTSLIQAQRGPGSRVRPTGTSVARTPVVVAAPRQPAAASSRRFLRANLTWMGLLKVITDGGAGGTARDRPGSVRSTRVVMLDPTRSAVGMAALMIAAQSLARTPDPRSALANVMRNLRESIVPDVDSQFAEFAKPRRSREGRDVLVLAPEQAVWRYNRSNWVAPAVAYYPAEGTPFLDYPFTVTTDVPSSGRAARVLEREVGGAATRDQLTSMGFRGSTGRTPPSFGASTGVSTARPGALPPPRPAELGQFMQVWAQLTQRVRILAMFDISGSMAWKAPGSRLTRLQATVRVAQKGLVLLPDDSDVGAWVFSTDLGRGRDWREVLPVAPLGERTGSSTHRQLAFSTLAGLRAKRNGDTGLYDSLLAAYRMMKRIYKPELVTSVVLFTDGKNEDADGIGFKRLQARLKAEYDPYRPIQVIMIGFGEGVDTGAVAKIAELTHGNVNVAKTVQDMENIFFTQIYRSLCDVKSQC